MNFYFNFGFAEISLNNFYFTTSEMLLILSINHRISNGYHGFWSTNQQLLMIQFSGVHIYVEETFKVYFTRECQIFKPYEYELMRLQLMMWKCSLKNLLLLKFGGLNFAISYIVQIYHVNINGLRSKMIIKIICRCLGVIMEIFRKKKEKKIRHRTKQLFVKPLCWIFLEMKFLFK